MELEMKEKQSENLPLKNPGSVTVKSDGKKHILRTTNIKVGIVM